MKMNIRIYSFLLVTAFLMVTVTSCKDEEKEAAPKAVTGLTLDRAALDMSIGGETILTATVEPADADNKTVQWTCDDYSVVTVLGGKVTPKGLGTATITATTLDGGFTAKCTVEVHFVNVSGVVMEATAELGFGKSQYMSYTVEPSNASNKDVTWTSDAPGIVSVDNDGNMTALAKGTANITVTTVDGSKTATCSVTVLFEDVTGVSVEPASLELFVGAPVQTLKCTVVPSTASVKDVTWESDAPLIAEVDQNGRVTAKSSGQATITATTVDGGKTATCVVNVAAEIPVSSVTINGESSLFIPVKSTRNLTCTVLPEFATDKSVVWSSSANNVVEVDANGKVTAKAGGKATITVTTNDGGFKANCVIEVNLIQDPGLEDGGTGWTAIPTAWFNQYYSALGEVPHPIYGNMISPGGTLTLSLLDNTFFATGNGAFFNPKHTVANQPAPTYGLVGSRAMRIGGSNAMGGWYQLADVQPGKMYYFSCHVGMRLNSMTTDKIKPIESVKFLSEDGTVLYDQIRIPVTNTYNFNNNTTVTQKLEGYVTIPASVTKVRVQVDVRSFANPNGNPLTCFDEFVLRLVTN